MLRRFILHLLIALVPIQSWAVVDMSLKKETSVFVNASNAVQNNYHPCHQEALSADDQSTDVNQTSCNACSLCMAFGASLISNPTLRFESPTQSFFISVLGFSSEDLILGNKPPIL
jgi:hypothetical protein